MLASGSRRAEPPLSAPVRVFPPLGQGAFSVSSRFRFAPPASFLIWIFLALLLSISAWAHAAIPPGWSVVSSTESTLRLRIELPLATVNEVEVEGRRYQVLQLQGYRLLGDPGLPLIPQRGAWLGVPPQGQPQLSVRIVSTEALRGGRLLPALTPQQPSSGLREELGSVKETLREDAGYEQWGLQSEDLAVLGEPVWSNGQRMVPLRVRPFLVHRAGERLEQVRVMEVIIKFSPFTSVPAPAQAMDSRTLARLLNPQIARRWHTSSPQARLRMGLSPGEGASRPSGSSTSAFPQESQTALSVSVGSILPVDQVSLLSDEYRIPVTETGLVRVHLIDLFTALGFPAGIRRGQLRLYIKRPSPPGSANYPVPLSEDVPLLFFGNPDPAGEITSSDIIIFYGISAQEDNVERQVGGETLPVAMKHRAENYNENNIYWLAAADPGSGSWARMDRESFTPSTGPARQFYDYQEHFGHDTYYQPNPVDLLETRYQWNSPFHVEERLPLRLRAIDPTSPLIVRWVVCSNLHSQQTSEVLTSFFLEDENGGNRTFLKTLDIADARNEFNPGTYGRPTAVFDTLSAGSFQPGSLRFRFHNVDEQSEIYHLVMVDSVSLYYRAAYGAESERTAFTTGVAGAEASLLIPGFTADEIFLVDITTPRLPRWIDLSAANILNDNGMKTLSLQVPPRGSTVRSFVALSSVEVPRVTDAEITRSTTAILTERISDIQAIALGPSEFKSAMQPWLQWRRENDRRGWNYSYVDVQEIFDQFSGGLHSPDSIKEFLHYAHIQWGAMAVLLVGDANEDHRRIVRISNKPAGVEDFVPTHDHLQYYGDFEVVGSDKWYVLFDINDTSYPRLLRKGPDMLLGRWPAQNAAQVAAIAAKAMAYEQPTEADTWRQSVIWMSDDAYSTGLLGGLQNPQYELSSSELAFQSSQEGFAAQTSAFLDGTMQGVSWNLDTWTAPIRGGETSFPFNFLAKVQQEVAVTARPALYATLSQGAFIVNFQGHANYNVLTHELLMVQIPGQTMPADEINNAGKLFLFYGMGCHAGDFLRTTDLSVNDAPSISETLMTHPGSGAIASYASSAFEFLYPNLAFGQSIADAFFGPVRTGQVLDAGDAQWILGDVMAQAEWDVFTTGSTQVPQMVAQYSLLGDPLLRMDGAPPRIKMEADNVNVDDGSEILPVAGSRKIGLRVDATDESGVDSIELTEIVDGQSRDLSDLLQPQSGADIDARRARSLADLPVAARGTDGGAQYELKVYDRAYPKLRPGVFRFRVPFELVVNLNGDMLPPGGRPVAPGELVAFTLDFTSPMSLAENEIELELNGLILEGLLQKQQVDTEGRQWELAFDARGQAGATVQDLLLTLVGEETVISLAGSAPAEKLAIKSHYPVPNPADPDRGPIRIVADLTTPAAWARVTIFDLSGRPVISWTDNSLGPETTVVLSWNGRDRRGDELANGTYLYKLEVGASDGEVQRGEVGRIVLMR